MRFLFNEINLFILGFIAFCFIVIGFFLHAILIPIQDFDLLTKAELIEFQKEYALNYPLGISLYYLGIFLILVVILLFIIRFNKKKVENQKRTKHN